MIDLSLPAALAVFVASGVAIVLGGIRMTGLADQLADRTGLGEALAGGLLLGIATSLSGVVASVTAAADGHASLAASNAVGGIAAQTVFLVIADLAYRKSNLEHAAADPNNLVQAALLVLLLGLPLAAYLTPPVTVLGVHPASLLLFAVYIGGTRMSLTVRDKPMWHPKRTEETREDVPEEAPKDGPGLGGLLLRFGALMAVVGTAGWAISVSGLTIAAAFGISETILGALMIAVITSLPELVTTLAAVRRGALQLAVGGIIGGNTFDALFLSFSDVAYREGSLYHAMAPRDAFLLVAGIVITSILLMGLIVREKRGVGFEGGAILATYAAIVGFQIWMG